MRTNERDFVFIHPICRHNRIYLGQRRYVREGPVLYRTSMKHIDVAKKLIHEWGRRMFIDLFRRTDLLNISLMHHHDTISHF